MYHVLFIHPSVDGHLGCFHVLAVVYSAAMNIEVHVSFLVMEEWMHIHSGTYTQWDITQPLKGKK